MTAYSELDLKRIKEQYKSFLDDITLISRTEDEGLKNALCHLVIDKYKSLRVTRSDIDRELHNLLVPKESKKALLCQRYPPRL